MRKVGIASCAHAAWIEASQTMVNALADAVKAESKSYVHVPVNFKGLIAALSESNYFIMHTHGSDTGFFDQRADGEETVIAKLSNVNNFPQFPKLRLVVITACKAAGGDGERNIAAALSAHIAQDGLVIANRYDVYGGSYDFGEKSGKHGWVGYQNGKLVLSEQDIPAAITMADAYRIYMDYTKSFV